MPHLETFSFSRDEMTDGGRIESVVREGEQVERQTTEIAQNLYETI
jgi:hypothetical protein